MKLTRRGFLKALGLSVPAVAAVTVLNLEAPKIDTRKYFKTDVLHPSPRMTATEIMLRQEAAVSRWKAELQRAVTAQAQWRVDRVMEANLLALHT